MKKAVWYLVGVLILALALVAVACAKPAEKPAAPAAPAAPTAPAKEEPAAKEPTSPEKTPASATFTTSNLTMSPTEVDTGKSITISILVTNTGGLTGSYKVTLKIDNIAVATNDVTLAGGASQTVTFTTAKDVAGTYMVNVDGLSGTFTVKTAPAAAPAGGTVHQVTIKNFAFSPKQITIKVGDTVTWTNQDSAPHTVTGNSFDSGNLAKGQSWSYTFNAVGTFTYKCTNHPSMQGQVTMGDDGASGQGQGTVGNGGASGDYSY